MMLRTTWRGQPLLWQTSLLEALNQQNELEVIFAIIENYVVVGSQKHWRFYER